MQEFYAIVNKKNEIIDIYNPEFTSKHPGIFRFKGTADFHKKKIMEGSNSTGTLKVVKVEVKICETKKL